MLCEMDFTVVQGRLPKKLRVTPAQSSFPRQSNLKYAEPDDSLGPFGLPSGRALLTFGDAQLRLLTYVRNLIRNGELTERALARQIGISQPHIHNALKGVRTLSPEVLDTILRHFHLSLVDLLSPRIGPNEHATEPSEDSLFQLEMPLYCDPNLISKAAS